jgi:hypothetical protein
MVVVASLAAWSRVALASTLDDEGGGATVDLSTLGPNSPSINAPSSNIEITTQVSNRTGIPVEELERIMEKYRLSQSELASAVERVTRDVGTTFERATAAEREAWVSHAARLLAELKAAREASNREQQQRDAERTRLQEQREDALRRADQERMEKHMKTAESAANSRAVGWALIGGAATGFAGGVVSYFLGSQNGRDLHRACPDEVCGPEQARAVETYDDLKTISRVSYIAGAVFATAGLVIIITNQEPDEPEPSISMQIGLDVGGLHLEGSF